jgi:hypothetical protein
METTKFFMIYYPFLIYEDFRADFNIVDITIANSSFAMKNFARRSIAESPQNTPYSTPTLPIYEYIFQELI